MSVGASYSVEDYLHTSYCPDREYRDGALLERNVGDKAHARLQGAIYAYLHRRRKQWHVEVYPELRVKVREDWYPIPDVCVYDGPDFEERYPSRPPLLWIEILSQDDRMIDVWNKANELVRCGVPNVWIIDPHTLESELRSPAGTARVLDNTLQVPGTDIVIPLKQAIEE